MIRISLACLLAVPFLSGCGEKALPQPPATPAAKPRAEDDLAYLTLSKQAYQSLGIQTFLVVNRPFQDSLTRTGWIMPCPGHEIILTAPAAGYVHLGPRWQTLPLSGEIPAQEEILTVKPVLSPVEQIQLAALKRTAEGDLTKARSSLKVAESEYQRLQELHKQGLRGQQELDQARRSVLHAQEDVQAAEDKLKLFKTQTIPVLTPRPGQIATVHVSPGQFVAAGAPLLTLIDLYPIWVRVPVAEADLQATRGSGDALVTLQGPLAGQLKALEKDLLGQVFKARRVGRLPQLDPASHTIDLLFELDYNQERPKVFSLPAPAKPIFVKDQMVTVVLPLYREVTRNTLVPDSAIVYDSFGGCWVYIDRTPANAKEHSFMRRRVELGVRENNLLLIRPPLPEGSRVVTRGAGALFSREFHHAPGQQADHDEDD